MPPCLPLQDTVLFLLSDHGTHGIWWSNEFELGSAEHKLPFCFVVAPDWLLLENPDWLEALTLNQRRLATHYDVHQAMRQLVTWPDSPPPPFHPGTRSLLEELPLERSCDEARIPEEYCACRNSVPLRRFSAVVDATRSGAAVQYNGSLPAVR